MSSENTIDKLEEILTSRYFLSVDETVDGINLCDNLGEEFELTEFPNKEFYLNLLQQLRLFFNAEFMFLKKKVNKALKSYQKLIIAIGETIVEFPDLYSHWQYDIDRLLLRIDARIHDSKAQIAKAQNKIVDADLLFVETINRYNSELEFEQNQNDYDHYFDSLGNIYQATGFLYFLRGKRSGNRKELYDAYKNLKKAKFLGQLGLNTLLEEIRNDTFSLILSKLENQAETFFNKGVLKTEAERFTEARISYQKSAQIYRSLKHIQPSIEYELQEQIQISSYYEAFAKSLMINDANEQASVKFSQANQTLQMVLQKIPSDALRQNFEPQIKYFQAMQLFCQAVIEYDKMLEIAPTHFNEAQLMLEEAKEKAGELNNQPLVNNCQEALNKLRSYQEIADIMFQEPKAVEDQPIEPSLKIDTTAEKIIPIEEKAIEAPKAVEDQPMEPSPKIGTTAEEIIPIEEKAIEAPKEIEDQPMEPSPKNDTTAEKIIPIEEKAIEQPKVVEELSVEQSTGIDKITEKKGPIEAKIRIEENLEEE